MGISSDSQPRRYRACLGGHNSCWPLVFGGMAWRQPGADGFELRAHSLLQRKGLLQCEGLLRGSGLLRCVYLRCTAWRQPLRSSGLICVCVRRGPHQQSHYIDTGFVFADAGSMLRYCRNIRPTWVKFNSKDTKESEWCSRF